MKGVFKNIYEILKTFGIKIDELDRKLQSIPDFEALTKAIQDHEGKITELQNTDKKLRADFDQNKKDNKETFLLLEFEQSQQKKNDNYQERITKLEELVEELKMRPVASGGGEVDYSILCMKEEYLALMKQVTAVEKRNIEQDDRLTNNELRLEKLE